MSLAPGDSAPTFSLSDQDGNTVDLASYAGRRVMLFFYPKANTPGCTQQACNLRDIAGQIGDVAILGMSPDSPKAQKNFDTKHGLGYPLLADTDHSVAEAYGVWKLKKNYGKEYMGIERSAFLIGADGTIEQAWYKISPKDTPAKLLEALGL
jgi:peroxiredoxin Q/BCP